MVRTLLPLLVLVGYSLPLRADDGIPTATLNLLKAATVFVKVQAGRVQATGSGFLMRVEGEVGYLITNHHVVVPDPRLPPGKVTVVFNSGRKTEETMEAEVLGTDAGHDLAVLRVKGKDLPKPIDLADKAEISETMTVWMLGFPFGEALSTTKGNPAITIGKGSVSSLRENDAGDVVAVQIDGDLNPGNSGGPVVDGKGRLVGVAVAKVRNTKIGYAIPPRTIGIMLNGRVGAISFHLVKLVDGVAELDVILTLIDPLKKLSKPAVNYIRSDSLKAPIKAEKGVYPALPGSQELQLKLEGGRASTRLQLKVADRAPVSFSFQPVWVNGEGKTVRTQPAQHTLDFSKTICPPGPIPLGKVPEPTEGKSEFGGDVRAVGDVTTTELKLEPAQTPRCLCWTDDGKAFFHLQANGVLRRIRLDGFKEEVCLDVGKKCGWLSLSSEGLVLTVSELQEVWLLDVKSLKVVRKINAPSLARCVSAPCLSVAFAVGAGDRQNQCRVIDLKTGEVVREYTPVKHPGKAIAYEQAIVSPDGKYLFALDSTSMHRLKIDGKELKYEQTSIPVVQGRLEGIDVSPDGSQVCLACGGGTPNAGKPYCTCIFAAGDLSKAALTLDLGPYPLAIGFDSKAGLIYGHNFKISLIVHDAKGVKQKEYELGGGSVRQFLPHPEGRRLLMLADSKFFFVELAK